MAAVIRRAFVLLDYHLSVILSQYLFIKNRKFGGGFEVVNTKKSII